MKTTAEKNDAEQRRAETNYWNPAHRKPPKGKANKRREARWRQFLESQKARSA